MANKKQLKRAIEQSREEIENLERKLGRSQVAIIISHTKPDDTDVDYFRTYAALIDVERENLQKLTAELKALN